MQSENNTQPKNEPSITEREGRLWVAAKQYMRGEISVDQLEEIEHSTGFPRPQEEVRDYTRIRKAGYRLSSWYAGGLIVINLIILQSFFSAQTLNTAGLISVQAFSMSLPLLSATLVINTLERKNPHDTHQFIKTLIGAFCFIVGVMTAMTGITAAFWRISYIAGVSFLVSALIVLIVYMSAVIKE